MATNNNTNRNAATPKTLIKWNGFTVAFGATDREARILGYMWDAQERTSRRSK